MLGIVLTQVALISAISSDNPRSISEIRSEKNMTIRPIFTCTLSFASQNKITFIGRGF